MVEVLFLVCRNLNFSINGRLQDKMQHKKSCIKIFAENESHSLVPFIIGLTFPEGHENSNDGFIITSSGVWTSGLVEVGFHAELHHTYIHTYIHLITSLIIAGCRLDSNTAGGFEGMADHVATFQFRQWIDMYRCIYIYIYIYAFHILFF